MSQTKVKRDCQLCLQERYGPIVYGVSLGQMDEEEFIDIDHKRVCACCFGKIKVYVLTMLLDQHRSKFEQVGKRFLTNPIEG